ncbi:hypothetical protein SAMN05216359_105328 [Roseateles sp. YR242]|uniref:hypothetical protein n=1 Tax=Roseateles sp. YR242 TaxID=1855305 RepID=UPI0008B8205B|nr:hypothetical protein [Roseateles sp. YR242]SEL13589.1 hypothetical protein SAMN05216359_105328 [Roseateles sp. YR242]
MSTSIETNPPVFFPARAFAFVAPFRAEHDIRYYLNGFAVEPHPDGGVIVAATNGHQLAAAYCKEGRTDRRRIFTCSKGLIAAAKKPRAAFVGLKNDRLTVIESVGQELKNWSEADGLETFIQSGSPDVTGNFPDVSRVIPRLAESLEPGLKGCVAARYVEAIGRATKLAADSRFNGCRHWTHKDGGIVLTRFPSAPNFLVLTMPMRDDDMPTDPLPAFVASMHAESDERQRKEAEAKAAAAAAADSARPQLKTSAEVPA